MFFIGAATFNRRSHLKNACRKDHPSTFGKLIVQIVAVSEHDDGKSISFTVAADLRRLWPTAGELE
jgi:hypothetical protein